MPNPASERQPSRSNHACTTMLNTIAIMTTTGPVSLPTPSLPQYSSIPLGGGIAPQACQAAFGPGLWDAGCRHVPPCHRQSLEVTSATLGRGTFDGPAGCCQLSAPEAGILERPEVMGASLLKCVDSKRMIGETETYKPILSHAPSQQEPCT